MRKMIIAALFICLCAVGVLLYVNLNREQEQDANLETSLIRWDNGEVEDSEKMEIMNALAERVITNPQLTDREIEALSTFISVFEADDLKVIQYIENPEYYGASGRESYHLAVYDDQSIVIDSQGSMRIEKMIKRDEHLYLVFATDYKVSNLTGIRIFAIDIDGRTIHQHSLINLNRLAESFVYDHAGEALYYEAGHIVFQEIGERGDEVRIAVEDAEYLMRLGEDMHYQLSILP